MRLLDDLKHARAIEPHRPWPRVVVNEQQWEAAARALGTGLDLLALWGECDCVHMTVRDAAANDIAVLSLPCPGGLFPSVAQFHPPAARLERNIRDLFGLTATHAPDARPWLDHGRWGVTRPLSPAAESGSSGAPYRFLAAEGESLHQIAVGPVHAGIIESGFFLFHANGETVVRLEERLGFAHRGIESLMQGADLAHGIKLAARMSGDSTVSYSYVFARAAEAALGLEAPPRGAYLRAVMAELERIANHLGDFGAICNDASFAIMQVQCAILRERVLRTSDTCFGHRLMRDLIVVGGVASDLDDSCIAALSALLDQVAGRLPRLAELYDKTASLQDRTVGTGILKPRLAQTYAAGGFVGRASGRDFDARKTLAYPPYDRLRFDVPVLKEGDVNARVWVRIREIEQSVGLIRQLLAQLPGGALRAEPIAAGSVCEGAALVEGFRGEIFAWLRLGDDGKILRCHLRDPSWFQWPLLEAAIEGNIVADFPLCNKSFNCSYAGHDA